MFNAFSKALLNKNISKNVGNTSNTLLINKPNAGFMPGMGLGKPGEKPGEKKVLSLKERLASVRNVQNNIAKKRIEQEPTEKNVVKINNDNEINNIEETKKINELNKNKTVETNLQRFKNYSAVVNEKSNNDNHNTQELEKNLKKRKRKKKHEMIGKSWDYIKDKNSDKDRKQMYNNREHNNKDDDSRDDDSRDGDNRDSDNRDVDNRDGDNRDVDNRDGDNRDYDSRDGDNEEDYDNEEDEKEQSRTVSTTANTTTGNTGTTGIITTSYNENIVKKRRPGRPSKSTIEERRREEERRRREEERRRREEEEDENGRYRNERLEGEGEEEEEETGRGLNKNYHNFSNNNINKNNRMSNVSNNDNEPIKQKRKRRKKKEMEELRAKGLIGKGSSQQKSFFNNNNNNNISDKHQSFNRNENDDYKNMNTNVSGQGENKPKRRRGRPKLSETVLNNTNDKYKSNGNLRNLDIRKFCSKEEDKKNNDNGNINSVTYEERKQRGINHEEGDAFKILVSAPRNNSFMKKTPNEIEQLEKRYKHNIQKGVTCVPLDYQEKGGGMAIIFIDTHTEYGPVRNLNGFMTFLVLESDSDHFFIDTGIKQNEVECEKHMQLLICPGDTYMFKNDSHEIKAKLLLILCNKMKEPLDVNKHIRDPTIQQQKG